MAWGWQDTQARDCMPGLLEGPSVMNMHELAVLRTSTLKITVHVVFSLSGTCVGQRQVSQNLVIRD
jgi:hypothetical protein